MSQQPIPTEHRLPRRTLLTVVVLLAVPVVAVLLVPTYAFDGPRVAGWPFFYWYQTVWVLIGCPMIAAAFTVLRRARGRNDR